MDHREYFSLFVCVWVGDNWSHTYTPIAFSVFQFHPVIFHNPVCFFSSRFSHLVFNWHYISPQLLIYMYYLVLAQPKKKKCYQHLIEIPLDPETQNKSTNKSITYTSQELREIRNKGKDTKLYLRLNPGTIKKVRDCRINRQRIAPTRHDYRPRGANTQTRGVNTQTS